MKGWQLHVDLQRLLTALGEELRAATDEEVRAVYGAAGQSIAAAARDVRRRIAAASGEHDEPDPGLPLADAVLCCRERCWRQHYCKARCHRERSEAPGARHSSDASCARGGEDAPLEWRAPGSTVPFEVIVTPGCDRQNGR